MKKSSKNRLTLHQQALFPGDTLFDKIARAVCRSGTLPRKELYEAWAVAKRVRRLFRGGRIVDLACGHGLVSYILLLLDDTSPGAVAVDTHIPKNAETLSRALIRTWPRLKDRVLFRQMPLEQMEISSQDIVVSVHACGALTDTVIKKALSARAKLAVLPCCHDLTTCDTGGLEGWMDGPLAIDAVRAIRLTCQGYTVMTKKIPGEITPKNRLLMAYPNES
ncbi:methyltransferase [uncultured Desulfobacter sp.]|uniref:methyltransferase n=1 Tax=uncultured Desulfobacter sp. TaxID=240139 RepID=UPI002AAA9128|nr:methyltransferase [uncultured Desulfobacter sp.]